MLEFFKKYKFQIIVGAILVFAMQASSKAMAFGAMRGLLRLALPFILVYIGYRLVKGMIKKKFQNAFAANPMFEQIRRQMEMQQNAARGASTAGEKTGTVIDICPSCGDVMKANHRC